MNLILAKEMLHGRVGKMVIDAPLIARKAQPGQFVILRTDAEAERVPLTVADTDPEKGTVTIIYQVVGAGTSKLNRLNEGEYLHDFVGPLGRATHTEGLKKVAVVIGGVGCAIGYPVTRKLFEEGAQVDVIAGFRTKEMVILEDLFRSHSTRFFRISDDGSWGSHGRVTDVLRLLLDAGERYDEVITIGPLIMMKFVCALTKEYNIPTIASMNPVMIDGTGMCGCCRLTVGGKLRFACVDGPEFDGHAIDFDEALARADQYGEFERHAYEADCNLMRGV